MTLMSVPSAYERATAYIIIALGFLVVGVGSLLLGNVPVAAGLLVASLVSLMVSLFYLTKEHRVKPLRKT
jgi:CHASE2 domain-containing sensor protein